MSSDHKNERLETLQKSYRRAWTAYAAEVEYLHSTQVSGANEHVQEDARQRVERAAAEYRVTRDDMALFLLDHAATLHPEFVAESESEPEFAACPAT